MLTSLRNKVVIYSGSSYDFEENESIRFLSEREKSRASQILHEEDRRCFVITRAVLRKLISIYTGLPNKEIKFQKGINGKLSVPNSELKFNVTHSKSDIVIALTLANEIGVDIESRDRLVDHNKLIDTFFSENEKTVFDKLEEIMKPQSFINCWTRKEAILKAKGVGLSFPVKLLEVSFIGSEPARVISTGWSQMEKKEWFLESVELPRNYVGAVAVHGKVEDLKVISLKELKIV
jgi:4'-phosphopantetheinyl transferase